MEIGKVQTFDLSTISVRNSKNSPLSIKFMGIDAGQGFEVKGKERTELSFFQTKLGKEGKRFAISKLGELHYRVVRLK